VKFNQQPALFGLQNTNRDFTEKADWGKNVFNNAFPASLACYMHHKKLKLAYLKLNKSLLIEHSKISVLELFKHDPTDKKIFFAFESLHLPFEKLVTSSLPRIDLVICTTAGKGLVDKCLRGIEIKLTALPDNSTADFDESEYGSELVVRPDTIVYLALAIISNYINKKNKLAKIVLPFTKTIHEWNSPIEMASKLNEICDVLNAVLLDSIDMQKPLMLQPIWKTKGKTLELEENCLDTFVWSDYGFTRLFVDNLLRNGNQDRVSRPMRTCVWLIRMLHDFITEGKISHSRIIRNINFGTQTDKAFAVNGRITRNYLKSKELLKPRVTKHELKNIILNGGEKMLSPERRFDAAILSNASLFD
jgi:hypothetical protein